MPTRAGEIVNRVKIKLGTTEEELSTILILLALWDIQMMLNNEQIFSQQNWFLDKAELGVPPKDSEIGSANFNSIVKVEYSLDFADPYQFGTDVKIVDFADFNQNSFEGRLVCAVYGTPARLAFNYDPQVYVPDFQFRMWYEPTPTNPKMNDNLSTNQAFDFYITALVMEYCLENYLAREVPTSIQRMIATGQKQFEISANRSKEQRPSKRKAAYGVDRMDGGYGRNWRY